MIFGVNADDDLILPDIMHENDRQILLVISFQVSDWPGWNQYSNDYGKESTDVIPIHKTIFRLQPAKMPI